MILVPWVVFGSTRDLPKRAPESRAAQGDKGKRGDNAAR